MIRTIADAMEAGKQKVKPEEFQEKRLPSRSPSPRPRRLPPK